MARFRRCLPGLRCPLAEQRSDLAEERAAGGYRWHNGGGPLLDLDLGHAEDDALRRKFVVKLLQHIGGGDVDQGEAAEVCQATVKTGPEATRKLVHPVERARQ
jgi:hypothetical protein